MNYLNKNSTGVAVGFVISGMHFLWSMMVLLGVGQMFMDFIFWAHMIHMQMIIGPFEFTAFATLLIVTFISGYIMGWLFAYVWNWLHEK